ncbi:MAG: hypothetical protein ACM359_18330 [Bacillota bacterium]
MQGSRFHFVTSIRIPINGRTFRIVLSDACFYSNATGKEHNSEIDNRNGIVRIYKHLSPDLFAVELAVAVSEVWRLELGRQSETPPYMYEPEKLAPEEMKELEADIRAAATKIAADGWPLPPNLPADVEIKPLQEGWPPMIMSMKPPFLFFCPHCGKPYKIGPRGLNAHLQKVHGWTRNEDGCVIPPQQAA